VAKYPVEVSLLIENLLTGAREALGDNLLGFYLRGSLALGDFNPETSDVDILVVTQRPISETEFEALAALHKRIPARDNQYGRHYEVSYVDRASLKRFEPGERVHPTIGSDWPFARAEHRENFVLERWMVREHGVILVGPDPKTLIDPISADELREAATGELRARIKHWAGRDELPDWLDTRYYQAFEVETICRALYTLEFGTLPTKPRAVAWALEALPERWRTLVEWSREHRADKTPDTARISEIIHFVRWAASRLKG
jgi:predicted nucleotidyltransferase